MDGGIGEGEHLTSGSRGSGGAPEAFGRRCRSAPTGWIALVVIGCLAVVGGALPPVGAAATTVGAHLPSFSFGEAGGGAGQFSRPSGIAVNTINGEPTSGDVYITDREDNRVEIFEPVISDGQLAGEHYVSSFSVPHPTAIAVDNCSVGSGPCSTAEDPSVGDVYVVGSRRRASETQDQIYKFSGLGTQVIEPIHLKQKPIIEAIAVGPGGTVYVGEQVAIEELTNGETNAEQASVPSEGTEGMLAVDAAGGVFAGSSLSLLVSIEGIFDENVLLEEVLSEVTEVFSKEHSEGNLAVVEKLDPSGKLLVPGLDFEESTGVAVADVPGAGEDVYVLNQTSSIATVAVFGLESEPPLSESTLANRHGQLLQRFEVSGLEGPNAIAVDPDHHAVFVVGGTSDDVEVYAEPSGVPSVGASEVKFSCEDEQSETELCPSAGRATTLSAKVDPAGVATNLYFEYGSGKGGSCEKVPCSRTPAIAVGEGTVEAAASYTISTGLSPGIYHYRAVAEGPSGELVRGAESSFTIEETITGLADHRVWELVSPTVTGGAEPELPEEGGLIQAAAEGGAITYVADGPLPANVAPEGNRSPEPTQELSVRHGSGWETKDITPPYATSTGVHPGAPRTYQFFSANLALSLLQPFYATSQLAAPPLSPAATKAEEGHQETTISLRADAPLEPEAAEGATPQETEEAKQDFAAALSNGEEMGNAGFLALVSKADQPGNEAFGSTEGAEDLVPSAATPDLSHVVFTSTLSMPGLYEWGGPATSSEEHEQLLRPLHEQLLRPLQLVSELPDGEHAKSCASSCEGEASVGGPGTSFSLSFDTRHTISNNGELVFWTYKPPASAHEGTTQLYVHDSAIDKTLRIDEPSIGEPPAPGGGAPAAVFETASVDGSRVFFLDTQRLTGNSTATERAPQLYVWERQEGVPLAGKLTDLTPQPEAHVVSDPDGGGVVGAANNGSDIFFVANGALAPGARQGECETNSEAALRPPRTTCSLYVVAREGSAWGAPRLVATLSNEDSPDWGMGTPGSLWAMTSGVSENGSYLAFMSDRSLTGYDNEDITSKHPGERMDEEVYLYHEGAGKGEPPLTCVSCNPSGARPHGVHDEVYPSAEFLEGGGLLVDRPKTWAPTSEGAANGIDHWLAASLPGWSAVDHTRGLYQPRYLLTDGRVFFDSADALTPEARAGEELTREANVEGEEGEAGLENVYEYEPGGVGSCISEGGCVSAISSRTSPRESAFLDASESGEDVYFITTSALSPLDTEETLYHVYDAHVCETTCEVEREAQPEQCALQACQAIYGTSSGALSPATGVAGSGDTPHSEVQVLSTKTVHKPKPRTRAQKLAAALKACRHDKKKVKRVACERAARKKYGPVKKSSKSKTHAGGKS